MSLEQIEATYPGQPGNSRRVVAELRPGLTVHAFEGVDEAGEDVPFEMDAGVSMSLVLAGSANSIQGGRELQIGGRPEGLMMALNRPERGVRKRIPGAHIRYVGVTMSEPWLQPDSPAGCVFGNWARRHMETYRWGLSGRSLLLANRLFTAPASPCPVDRMRMEGVALELVATVCSRFRPAAAGLGAAAFERARKVREMIREEPDAITCMADICNAVGANPTTLQQQFRQVYGVTIFDALRKVKLGRGVEMLEQGASVAQAAYVAGYSSPANFATAVKRTLGVNPRKLKVRRAC